MKNLGMIRNISVYENENINFIEIHTNRIYLGKYFRNLDKNTQNTLLNRALIGIEYVNTHKLNSSKNVESEIDVFMNSRAYSLDVIISALKNMYSFLKSEIKNSENDQITIEMQQISERYINLQSYSLNTNRRITA